MSFNLNVTWSPDEATQKQLDRMETALNAVGAEYVAARDAIDIELRQEIAALVAKDVALQEGISAAFEKAAAARALLKGSSANAGTASN